MNINWKYPEPRHGFSGAIDKIIGPGATPAEKAIQLWIPVVAIAIVCSIGVYQGYDWSLAQYLVAAFFALDMVGGIATNLTSTAKRWNFRAGNGFKEHMFFIGLHIIQLSLMSYFFLGFDLVWLAVIYGYLMLSVGFILICPFYLQRPISGMVYVASLVLSIYVFKSPEHLEWFLPLFFYKLQISHAVREEPYRPDSENE